MTDSVPEKRREGDLQVKDRCSRVAELLGLTMRGLPRGPEVFDSEGMSMDAERVAKRLGLTGDASEPISVSHMSPELLQLLGQHGRERCTTATPSCGDCTLRSFCLFAAPPARVTQRPTVVELFAGAGGLGLGFAQAGYHVLAAFERDRDAAQTYRLNHPGTRVIERDVRTVDSEVLDALGLVVGTVDVLAAGPPCQGYSAAGRRDASDPINQLFTHVSRIARLIRPKIIVIENVLGARGVGGVDFANTILRSLHRSGYRASTPSVLLAARYGVPQNRRRLVFIGRRSDLGSAPTPPPPTHQPRGEATTTSGLPLTRSVRDALGNLPEYGPGIEAEYAVLNGTVVRNGSTMAHSARVVEKIRTIEQGKGPLSYRRLSDEVAATLIAGHRAMPVHPWLHRTISVREAARIQGFPDEFVFAGPRANQPLQVANAVPPPLAKAIACHVRGYLEPDKDGSLASDG